LNKTDVFIENLAKQSDISLTALQGEFFLQINKWMF